MAANSQRAPSVRDRKSFATALGAFWHRIEPGLATHDSFIENWAATGEGPAKSIAFEGFGFSLIL
ncbi:MAG TPA: hypothetical protein VF637_06020, partial [Sphingomicrobium sp.]